MSADQAASDLLAAFERYNQRFAEITQRARKHFLASDWQGLQADTMRRYALYDQCVNHACKLLRQQLTPRHTDPVLWRQIRQAYWQRARDHSDLELTLTFYNSVSRRVCHTVGVAPDIEFLADQIDPAERVETDPHLTLVSLDESPHTGIAALLSTCALGEYLGDCQALAKRIWPLLADRWQHTETDPPLERLEMLPAVFYQHARAYLVGRAVGGEQQMPVLLAMACEDGHVRFDALLTSPAETSMIFGFTRSYCMADLKQVSQAVVFLRKLMPHKPLAELYTVLGRVKQGKTERFRHFLQALGNSDQAITAAPGIRGMVMIVFWLPGLDLVFKVIRDRFDYPKSVRRRQVLERYRLVFQHDRAGRLIDAQEYRELCIPLARFSDAMREELLTQAKRSTKLRGDTLVIHHCYTERRLTPLNLYLQEASEVDAREVIQDYGQAIRDLAISNIFPGDLLLKNFGVTRHRRVIFYDYDEICLLTDCRFRRLPEAPDESLDLFQGHCTQVDEFDIFPEQFPPFMGLNRQQQAWFREDHAELLDPAWWQATQQRIRTHGDAGQIVPYKTT